MEAHIFLCLLAYHLPMSIEKTLLDAGVHTSWATVRENLKTHQVNTIVLPTDGGMVSAHPARHHGRTRRVGNSTRNSASVRKSSVRARRGRVPRRAPNSD